MARNMRQARNTETRGKGLFSETTDPMLREMKDFPDKHGDMFLFLINHFEHLKNGCSNIVMNPASLKGHLEHGRDVKYYQGYYEACNVFATLFEAVKNEWARRITSRAAAEKSGSNPR